MEPHEVQVGYQIGIAAMLPLSEDQMARMLLAAIEWQDEKGPVILFIDETFYRMILRAGLEGAYVDMFVIEDETDMETMEDVAQRLFGDKIVPVGPYEGEVDMEKLPEDIQARWATIHQMEEIIFQGGCSN